MTEERKVDVMERIAQASRGLAEEAEVEHWVTIYVMGKAYRVPADLTIMQAMEYAGFRFIRSCGCRAGFCGACATVFRRSGDYKLYAALACQTRVEEGMYLVQIPFVPAEKALYDVEKEPFDPSVVLKHYPEVLRCVACNTCTKACPQDLQVMDLIQGVIRGDLKAVAEGSFECVQCGLCAMRCPAEIVHYHVTQLVRRLYGKYAMPLEPNLEQRVREIEEGEFEEEFERVMSLAPEELKEMYVEQQRTREVY